MELDDFICEIQCDELRYNVDDDMPYWYNENDIDESWEA